MDTPALQPTAQCISGISADDPYYLIVRCLDPAIDGQLRTLAHLSGGCRVDANTYRYPYEVICRLAGRQQRGERFALDPTFGVNADVSTDTQPVTPETQPTDRLCPCGKPLTGRVDQKHCSPRCRQQASRTNPQRLTAQKRRSRSVTAMIIPATRLSHLVEASRRTDGSLRDTFSDVPAPSLLSRMNTEAVEHNQRTALKYHVSLGAVMGGVVSMSSPEKPTTHYCPGCCRDQPAKLFYRGYSKARRSLCQACEDWCLARLAQRERFGECDG